MKRLTVGDRTMVNQNCQREPVMSIHALTNLDAGHSYELVVPVGEDVAGVAKAFLADKELDWDVQEGFFVSVFPTGQEEGPKIAQPPANLDSSPTGTPYDTQSTPGYQA